MSLRKLRYLKMKQSELSFAMHYLPNNAVSFDDEPYGLLVTFLDLYLSIRFYKDLDAGDDKTYLRTELYTKNKFGEPLVFGRVMFTPRCQCWFHTSLNWLSTRPLQELL